MGESTKTTRTAALCAPVGGTQTLIEASMGDAPFLARTGPDALADIANAAVGTAPAIERMFVDVAPLQSAGPDEVSFLDDRRYAAALEQTMAGAVIEHPQMQRFPAAP
jgi:UDP-3-O-[3-hydroxymyristoyl] glucosamine N-acyltransferase